MGLVQRVGVPAAREKALREVFEHILYEDRVTSFIDIGPVNKVLNAFVHHFQSPGGDNFRRAFAACELYLWEGHDGVKMQGYNNSRLWDTAFATQAILASTGRASTGKGDCWRTGGASSGADAHAPMLEKAYGYLRENQILADVPEAKRHFRHPSRGGWPFSNRAHGWPITDCTSEGLKCALALEGSIRARDLPMELLRESVRLILSWQNEDGGWATYEKQRGGAWLEALNPSQVFGDIMVDYSYVECTSACLQALVAARHRFDWDPGAAIEEAVSGGARFLREKQRPDGSFEGSWGVCFTYGTWFGVTGLLAAGASHADRAITRACEFLLSKQRQEWRLGRGRSFLPGAAMDRSPRAAGGSNLLGAVDSQSGPASERHRAAAGGRVSRRTSGAGWELEARAAGGRL